MIGQWRHPAFRFRIILVSFAFVMVYCLLWIFKFQIVTYHRVEKNAAESGVSTLRKTMNYSAPNSDQKLKTANGNGESINVNDPELSNNTEDATEIVTIVTFVNFNETDYKKSNGTEKKKIHDLKNSISNAGNFKTIMNNKYVNIDGPLEKVPEHIYSKNVSVAKQLRRAASYVTLDMQGKQNESLHRMKEERTYIDMFKEGKKIISRQQRENNKTHQNMPLTYKGEAFKSKYTLNMTKESATSNQQQFPLIQMDLKDTQNSNVLGSMFANKNTDKVEMSVKEPQKKTMYDTFSVDLKPNPELKPSMNGTSKTSYVKSLPQHADVTPVTCKDALHASNKTKIGILIPSSTRDIQSPLFKNLTLVNISLPSVYKTLEPQYIYRVYIGIDEGDFLQTVQDKIKNMFDCAIPVVVQGKNYVKCVNTIADRAYKDGMDYIVRINDDTLFETPFWTSAAIKKLKEYNPANIGVVGPTCNEGNTDILTHDMVHRKHLEIFDFYYPPYLENWWTDDWITRVYEPNRSTKLGSWIVKHVIFKTRYKVDKEREQWSKTLISYDRKRLQVYIGCSCSCAINIWLSVPVLLAWLICLNFNLF